MSNEQPIASGGAMATWPMRVVVGAGVYAVATGLITMVGWAANIVRLTDWKADGISMFPNTAACAAMSGLGLLWANASRRRSQTVVRCLAIFVMLVGGLTLVEHIAGIDLGLDTLLFDRPVGQLAAAAPMRMGPPASLSFLLTGTALLLVTLGGRARRASTLLGAVVVAIGMLSLTGHLYGASQMYMLPRLTGIAMQTASVVVALGVGLLASVPEHEPMRTLLERSAAGMLTRRASPVLVVLALALGGLRVFIETQGLVDGAFGTALRTLLELGLLTGLLWWAAALVRTHEQARHASDAEVQRHAKELATFLDTAAIALHRVGPDGTIIWANDAELNTFGYGREEYIGHHIADFHVDGDVIADILARLHRDETLCEYPARMKCKDGSIKHVVIDSSVLWDEGRFVHTQCFTRDVTERKRADEARALLASIIETSDDAIASKTLDGVITSWNRSAQRIFGYTSAEAVGKHVDIIIPPERLDEEREILRRLARDERIDHFETVRRAKDGRRVDVSLTISPVKDASGHVIGASKIARDITERKRAETEREESNRRKDEFIAILAHELRNPLAPVRNVAHYLKLKVGADPELRHPIDMIERQVALMSRLIDDLLDVSRVSRGRLELRRERVWCAEIVEAAVDACRDEVQARSHHLRVTMPPDPTELEADRERLVQVLCNLIGNAVKYTPSGGEIDVAVAVTGDGTLEISVRDNGQGIPPEKLTDIFDLFVRVDNSLERQDGLGIGLTLVRQLVELHGGTIEGRSKGIGYGSEFVVRLPILASSSPALTPSPEARPTCPPLRILVADDNHDAAESLALLLGMAGHEVHTVFDGEAAIEAIERLRPQVALLDIGMPKANGYEVARRVREHTWSEGAYLVALTGWGQEADKRRAHEAGFDAHLAKPIAPETLHHLLSSIGRPEETAPLRSKRQSA